MKFPVSPSRACYFQLHSGGCLLPWGRGAFKLQTRTVPLVAEANVQAVMPLRLFPRPARRVRAVSAAIGRFDRTPTSQVQTNRPMQLLPSCIGRRSPSRATKRAEMHSILLSRSMSQAPCPCTLLRACADAQGRDKDCTVGPPAAASAAPISASVAEPVWRWPMSVLDLCSASPPRPCVHMQAALSCGT